MTSLCLWGPIQRPLPRCRTLTWSPTCIGLRGFEELSWSTKCSTGRFEKFWNKMNVFILLSIHYQFIINSLSIRYQFLQYHVTLVFGTHKWIYIMSLHGTRFARYHRALFAHREDCQFFLWATLDSRILPPACTENKREGEEQKCSCHHDHSDFPNACVAPTMWTCTLPLCYAFALAHRAISAIRRAVGLRPVQASTGDWTKPGQRAKESVLSITLFSVGSH